VFDLTVETDHEFFANGVLVHNCADLREEIAAWRYLRDGMDQADFGLRKGTHRWVGATTPKPRPTIRKLVKDPRVVLITATTDDNPHLAADKREELYEKFGNTRLGKQELEAKILEDQAGALWTQELIEQYRVTEADVPRLIRVRTYVDPSWGTTHDECGIVVCGLGVNRHLYVLADLSKRTTPSEWGMLAAIGRIPPQRKDGSWVLEPDWEPRDYCGKVSECVVAEKNFQGEQVRLVMKLTSRDIGQRIRFGWVNSSQGKRLRAEPVVQLFERGKVHMVGSHEHLEWQLTNWVPPEASDGETDQGDPVEHEGGAEDGQDPSKWSPDRLDAMVFGCSDLLIGPNSGTGKLEIADGRVPRPSLERSAGPQSKGPQIGAIPMSTRQGRIIREQQAERRPAE
jgi:phage terminase large subunit-like protein